MKRFALNDAEDKRNDMIGIWTNEQAMREIYLKPFELCVKEVISGLALSHPLNGGAGPPGHITVFPNKIV